jgi:cytochrome oxidase assembly protein ShyY1
MDHNWPMPIILSLVTFFIIIGLAIYQLKRVKRSQEKRGEHPGGIAGPD